MMGVVTTPIEFQGNVTGDLNRRRGLIVNSEERGNTTIVATSNIEHVGLFVSAAAWAEI